MKTSPIALLAFLIFAASCSVFKPATEPASEKKSDYYSKNEFNYKYLSAGFTIDISGEGMDESFRGRVRGFDDSLIWFSFITPFGMEAVRMQLTPDSLAYMNRLEKSYFKGSLKTLRNILGFSASFEDLQSLFFGKFNLRALAPRNVTKGDSVVFIADKQDFQSRYIFNERNLIHRFVKDFEDKGIRYEAKYESYENTGAGYFPGNVSIAYYERMKLFMDIRYTSVAIKETLDFPFNIPESYTFQRF